MTSLKGIPEADLLQIVEEILLREPRTDDDRKRLETIAEEIRGREYGSLLAPGPAEPYALRRLRQTIRERCERSDDPSPTGT